MKIWFVRFACVGALACCQDIAHAETGEQLFKLLAADGDVADFFGWSVATDGTTAIVGALLNDDACQGNAFCDSGSAYLFDVETGQQLFKLLADDSAEGDSFGQSVAISDHIAIVGAVNNRHDGQQTGSAYIFDATNGQQLFKLLASDAEEFDSFGTSVAISGTTAIVGANRNNENGRNSGAAYLFDTATGQQRFRLLASDGEPVDAFGISVAISGSTAIVGANGDDDNGNSAGAAYLFDTATGQQLFKLLPNQGMANEWFGWSVAISGDIAIVGTRFDDKDGLTIGAAYLFDTTTGKQLFRLLASDGAPGDHFGTPVAINGSYAIVSATGDDDACPEDPHCGSGAVYLFDVTTGQQLFKFRASDGKAGHTFGLSVAASGTSLIVGALGDDDNGSSSGAGYLFDAQVCPTDLNNDGVMDMADLGGLLGAFGNSIIPYQFGDINGDGVVDTADLGILLGAFGQACP